MSPHAPSADRTTTPALAQLPEADRAAALARFRMLRPHLEAGVPLAQVARAGGLQLRTLQRWLRAYRQQGLIGLARRARRDRGTRALPTPLVGLIEGLALRSPRPTAAAVHRHVMRVAREQGWPVPSYSTVYAVIRGLDPALTTLAHEGATAYQNAFDLIHRRTADRPNAVWQADHTPLDVWVLDHRGTPARPWLTVILDDYSRAVAGYALSLTAPSALQTALALRQAIWRKGEPGWHVCGIPDTFYTDHGADFTSRHLEQVAADIKMQLVFSTAGQPRGRGKIERFLAALPGYTPPGSAPPPTPTLTLSELETGFRSFVVADYHQRIHSETGAPPQARWDAGGFLPRLPDSLKQLDLLLLTVATPRKVHPDGIHFQGMRYLDPTLAAYVGEAVTIRYDPRDLAELWVYHRDTFVCRAICPELAGETIALKDLVRARTERRRGLRTTLTDRERLVATYLEVHDASPQRAPLVPVDEGGPSKPRLKRYLNE